VPSPRPPESGHASLVGVLRHDRARRDRSPGADADPWTDFARIERSLARIVVREKIAAQPIVLVRRTALALTRAAELLADLLRRAAIVRTGMKKS
jgi:hypothetical protein